MSGWRRSSTSPVRRKNHQVIPGPGGFGKVRWAGRGKGKSDGFRVVYFFLAGLGRICMAAIYAKSRMDTLSAADQNVLARLGKGNS